MQLIVRFLPHDHSPGIIHRIILPDPGQKGQSNELRKWNGFAFGRRRVKPDLVNFSDRHNWSPEGMYSCHDTNENSWRSYCATRRELLEESTHYDKEWIDERDERLWPLIDHASMDAFFEYIGYDRTKKRFVGVS